MKYGVYDLNTELKKIHKIKAKKLKFMVKNFI